MCCTSVTPSEAAVRFFPSFVYDANLCTERRQSQTIQTPIKPKCISAILTRWFDLSKHGFLPTVTFIFIIMQGSLEASVAKPRPSTFVVRQEKQEPFVTNPSRFLSLSLYPSIYFNLLLQNMWIERTTYSTAYKLPGILRWFEVKSVSLVSREESASQSGKQPEGSSAHR